MVCSLLLVRYHITEMTAIIMVCSLLLVRYHITEMIMCVCVCVCACVCVCVCVCVVNHGVLTIVGEIPHYRNDCYYHGVTKLLM